MGDGANQVSVYSNEVASEPCHEVSLLEPVDVCVELLYQLNGSGVELKEHLCPSLDLKERSVAFGDSCPMSAKSTVRSSSTSLP